jgi:hypothetical protein
MLPVQEVSARIFSGLVVFRSSLEPAKTTLGQVSRGGDSGLDFQPCGGIIP